MAVFRERLLEAVAQKRREVERGGAKLSQNAIAREAGIGSGQLSRLIRGERAKESISIDQLVGLSEALNVRIDWLCGKNVPMREDVLPAPIAELSQRLYLVEKQLRDSDRPPPPFPELVKKDQPPSDVPKKK